jgi:hypothetical protein
VNRTGLWFLFAAGWLIVAAGYTALVSRTASATLLAVAGIAVIIGAAQQLGSRS